MFCGGLCSDGYKYKGPQERGEAPLGGFELSAVGNKSKGLNKFVMDHMSISNEPFSRAVLNSGLSLQLF